MRTISRHIVSLLLTLVMLVSMVICPTTAHAADPAMAGDLNGHGKITAGDALEVLKSVVGKVTFTDAQNTSSAVDSSVTSASKDPKKVIPNLRETAQKECDDYFATIYNYMRNASFNIGKSTACFTSRRI